MTREQFLCKKVEEVTTKIIAKLNERDPMGQGFINKDKINWFGFLYSCGRLDPIIYLLELTSVLHNEELKEVIKELKEKN